MTREACRALLLADHSRAEALIEEAFAFGERIFEPDAGNVFMSQRLELVRARGEPDELRDFAGRAVAHWVGAPVHAHAVAAGFLARAGDLDGARAHAATVVELGTWRADRSYLWSVFVRELAHAAVALDDTALCAELLEDLDPVSGACGVNGAAVAFAGSLGHTAGLLAQHVGRGDAGSLLADAAATYERLGAAGWLADVRRATAAPQRRPTASMRRQGTVWQLRYAGKEATVSHTKGLADLARLVGAAGREVHVLDLAGSDDRSASSGPMVDGVALAGYRQRLDELDAAIDEATVTNDLGRRANAEQEREAVVAELARVLGPGGGSRTFANNPAERARKAVSARIRDAIRKLDPELPELAAHLEQSIVTGGWCRYRPGAERWEIDLG